MSGKQISLPFFSPLIAPNVSQYRMVFLLSGARECDALFPMFLIANRKDYLDNIEHVKWIGVDLDLQLHFTHRPVKSKSTYILFRNINVAPRSEFTDCSISCVRLFLIYTIHIYDFHFLIFIVMRHAFCLLRTACDDYANELRDSHT